DGGPNYELYFTRHIYTRRECVLMRMVFRIDQFVVLSYIGPCTLMGAKTCHAVHCGFSLSTSISSECRPSHSIQHPYPALFLLSGVGSGSE
ncbi:hypothetical protein PMAYCL1PPCAC_16761, partial [Pristionchus mayeri]